MDGADSVAELPARVFPLSFDRLDRRLQVAQIIQGVEDHRQTTAEEIWKDTNGKADIIVSAVGTGGTLTGISEVIKSRKKDFRSVAVEPKDSPVITQTRNGEPAKPGPHKIQGTGAGFVPKNLNLHIVDDVVTVSNEDAITTARRLALEDGILAGISTGANVWAALNCETPGEQGQADRDDRLQHRRALPQHRAGGRGTKGSSILMTMNTTIIHPEPRTAANVRARRSLTDLLAPLDQLAATSTNLIAKHDARFDVDGRAYDFPRYVFIGPKGGDEPIRIGLFAAIHGDEPVGAHALVQLLQWLDQRPEVAEGYCLFVYPVCNPTGFEDRTRHSRRDRDLNREFWNNSQEPEVQLLQAELVSHAFHGIISLHADDSSDGVYGFVSGATLTRHLIEPALRRRNKFCRATRATSSTASTRATASSAKAIKAR